MRKEEKTRQTRERILHAALTEYGERDYDAVSINSICRKYQISKGLIYHNFTGKDELYLLCVQQCFDRLTAHLNAQKPMADTVEEGIRALLDVRQAFFRENPYYRNIFYNVLLYPAEHLTEKIKAITGEYERYIRGCYRELLAKIPLREGITLEMAVEYLSVLQEIYNGYYQRKAWQSRNFTELIEEHEMKISNVMEIVLYGISAKAPKVPGKI